MARRLATERLAVELESTLEELHAELADASGALPPDMEIEFAVIRATLYRNQEDYPAASAELAGVACRVPEASGTIQGRFHATTGLVASGLGNADLAVDQTVLAVATLADEPASAELAIALGTCALAFSGVQLFPLAAVVNEQAITTAAEIGFPTARFHVHAAHIQLTWGMRQDHLGVTNECHKRWEEAIRQHELAMGGIDTLPPIVVAEVHLECALAACRLGRTEDARRLLTAALDLADRPSPAARRGLAHAEGAVLLAEGDHAGARDVLARLWDSVRGTVVPSRTEDVPLLLARVAEASGNWAEALDWYREVYTRWARAQYAMWQARATAARLRIEQDALLRRTRQLESDALSDALTLVPNRRAFDRNLPRLVAEAQAVGATPLTLVIIDVDWFKLVNDEHGHPVGDEVLRRIARILREHSREADRCARYGGDEFALCLPIGADEAAGVVDRICRAVAEHPWETVSPRLAVTISCGLAELTPSDTPASLFNAADQRLLAAKRSRPPRGNTPVVEEPVANTGATAEWIEPVA